jgi:phage gp16-like protein
MSRRGDAAPDPRKRELAMIHIAKTQLGLDEDTYRAMLRSVAGVESSPDLSAAGRHDVLEHLKRLGFQPLRKRSARADDWRAPRVAKIAALWRALAEAGVVRDRSERAMLKWCAGVTHKARLEWATGSDLNTCIEALKSWAAREAVAIL